MPPIPKRPFEPDDSGGPGRRLPDSPDLSGLGPIYPEWHSHPGEAYDNLFDINLIHSADSQSRLVGIIVFTHVRTSVKSKYSFQMKTMFTTNQTVGLAEWIIDDTCFVLQVLKLLFNS